MFYKIKIVMHKKNKNINRGTENIFLKNMLPMHNTKYSKTILQNKGEIKTFEDNKAEELHPQQIYLFADAKDSPSVEMKRWPNSNVKVYKSIKFTNKGKYIDTYTIL